MDDSAGFQLRSVGLLALLVAVLSGAFIDRDLVNSLETGYAVTVQETVRDGHWIVPTQNGLPRLLKPPIPFWVSAAACRLAGATEAPVALQRTCSAVFGGLTAILVYLFGCLLFDRRAGRWAGLIWATCYISVYEMRYARHDIYLTCFIALAMMGIWMVLESRRGGWPITLLGVVLAFQAKGPVSWGLTVLPALVYIGWCRRDRWPMIPGLAGGMALATVSLIPWALAMRAAMPVDLIPMYFHETVGRFRSEEVPGASPFYYAEFLAYTLPWLVFLLAGFGSPFTARDAAGKPGRRFAWIWLVAGLVFLSLAKEKRARYAVPLMAPAALLMGEVVACHLRALAYGRDRRVLIWRAHSILIVAAAIGVPIGLAYKDLLHPGIAALSGVALVALASIVGHAVYHRAWTRAAGWSVAYAVAVLLVMLGAQAVAPSYREPMRELAGEVDAMVEGHPVITWRDIKPPLALIYYAHFVAPQIGHPLMIGLSRPDAEHAALDEALGHETSREALFKEVLSDHLGAQRVDTLFVICEPRRAGDLKAIAGEAGFDAQEALDLTTLQPRKLKPRMSIGLYRLDRRNPVQSRSTN